MKKKTKKLLAIATPILLFIGFGLDVRLKTVTYTIESEKIEHPITIGLIADLHSCNYGKNQSTLISAIEKEKPDLLLLAGDIIDDDMPEVKAWEFFDAIQGKYPTYYVTGNHEYYNGEEDRLRNDVLKRGVEVLRGETIHRIFNNQVLDISGIDDRLDRNWNNQLMQASEQRMPNVFSVLITHRPEELKQYSTYNYDLVVAGHAHGGQWRIPLLVNGVFAPNQGIFPKLAGGIYNEKNTTMIVSRGLARESTRFVPRFYNRPELVIIKLVPKK